MATEREGRHDIAAAMHDPRISDHDEQLVDRHGLDDEAVDQIVRVMQSLRGWHDAERRMSEASSRYMKLNTTDMRALRFLIAARNQREIVTPGALSEYLGISSASTTKLLDRLEHGAHVVRAPHPTDRRALAISVTDATRIVARETVGRQHARRFAAAAALAPAEREVVIRFLDALSATELDQD
ncbi:MarR family winged helix-turn-helix transcriptional regulator [Agromyces badenianii]|uniref:MarR family winged helix-turn-helix transcriptional regulator n=1 Tax=Agromyces badenianii TaxID=2080742 RepID=UPI001F22DCE9|nr:MarR family transcriptional regulator [Agromyces badenianii]